MICVRWVDIIGGDLIPACNPYINKEASCMLLMNKYFLRGNAIGVKKNRRKGKRKLSSSFLSCFFLQCTLQHVHTFEGNILVSWRGWDCIMLYNEIDLSVFRQILDWYHDKFWGCIGSSWNLSGKGGKIQMTTSPPSLPNPYWPRYDPALLCCIFHL